MIKRKSGILTHISSLPSKHGIGDLGNHAFQFIDQLKNNGFSVWQILPLNPVGPGDSPYQAYSAYAGESLFISLETLCDWGLIFEETLTGIPKFPKRKVDYEKVRSFKEKHLQNAWHNFKIKADSNFHAEFIQFKEEHNWWMNDYALYKVCKENNDGLAWNEWGIELRQKNADVVSQLVKLYSEEIEYTKFVQFMFYRQWFQLKEYANSQGISIFGDLPLYVSLDSSDVWGNQDLFLLDAEGKPTKVGGVPPDYFSEDGQLWGNPVFNWNKLEETNYQWWISRLYFNFHLFDLVRIDHFRGLESFWAIPAGSETAKSGEWLPANGHKLLSIMDSRFDELPIIAEDLGIITPEVEKLRDDFNLPGMKVLQFAFSTDQTNEHLPHNYKGRNVVYTGTHDNDTLVGWLDSAKNEEAVTIKTYLNETGANGASKAIELAWGSTAELAIIPIQDVLGLDEKARMNVPGVATGNWQWRYHSTEMKPSHLKYFKALNTKYNRSND